MAEVQKVLSSIVAIGAQHDPYILESSKPQLEEKIRNVKHIHQSFSNTPTEHMTGKVLADCVEFTERYNGYVARWAQEEKAGPEFVRLLSERQQGEVPTTIARVTLSELQASMASAVEALHAQLTPELATQQ